MTALAGCSSDAETLKGPDVPPELLDGQPEDDSVRHLSKVGSDTGLVIGAIQDEAGHAIAGARISLDGVSQEQISSPTGHFVFDAVPAGKYDFYADSEDFARTHARIEVVAGSVTRIEVTMARLPSGDPGADGVESRSVSITPSTWRNGSSWAAAIALVAGVIVAVVAYRALRRGPAALAVAGRKALADDRPKDAERLARKAVRRDPGYGDGWFVLGAALIHRGAHQEAVRVLETAARNYDPQVAGIAFLLTVVNGRMGRHLEARRWLPLVARDDDYWDALDHDADMAFHELLAEPTPRRRTDPAYA